MVYVISYDLNQPVQNYTKLYETIKQMGTWAHPVDSTWYVKTTLSAAQIRDALKAVTDSNDKIIVSRVQGGWAWSNLSATVGDWIKTHLAA